ncbi:D-isomer specific 2-hydroxyacid dehydrogenase [Ameyamaea chiangmaiensis NBRC 103196]|uniref:D-glycerate dehydrogenase n=1 Tax=Ameyamaea chiangmaiensis TaxID=442969 RepID=A0A850PD16_9PROT|nr:D-glycerate dehydrogenase [Ameyamaea chiangmaiensis]MBS4074717.1 D-glycerate dehydrogenase [Ameyamaea chiangmaiensis]NVN42034.1 D-glycerate dehydrogenase [Ameyamaea chiangmaiensis]GBQ62475.1 D-isomer specific 2-hydroxyacid dehydrogenase [Ameyamaea chiangmaiensis NBRC 103196]
MSADRPRLIRDQIYPAAAEARLAELFTTPAPPTGPADTATMLSLARSFEPAALLISHATRADAAFIAALPDSVKVIACVSVGIEHVDIPAARARGIMVTNTPDVLTDCNADLAMMLILGAARRASDYTAVMRAGWGRGFGMAEMLGMRVTGKRLGIVGMGRIGRAVAHRARGFDMTILYHNRRPLGPDQEQGAQYFADLRDMLPHCDILSLHLPGGDQPVMTRETFALLPKGALFVNAARGAHVDEDALIDALQSGHLFGAGLDVYRNEPNPDPRLLALPNLFMTPHMGSATHETRTDMACLAFENARRVIAGETPLTPVSG